MNQNKGRKTAMTGPNPKGGAMEFRVKNQQAHSHEWGRGAERIQIGNLEPVASLPHQMRLLGDD